MEINAKNARLIISSLIGIGLVIVPFVIQRTKYFVIDLKANEKNTQIISQYLANLEQEIKILQQEKKYHNHKILPLKHRLIFDNQTILLNINSGKTAFGFVTPNYLVYSPQQNFNYALMTKNYRFKNDDSWNSDDPTELTKIAEKDTEIFNSDGGYHNWNDKDQKWNGNDYHKFYSENETTAYYRGAIYIWGTQQKIDDIKSAWSNKNWSEFLDHGIMAGKPSSAGKFLLQQQLLKKHFNLSDSLVTLAKNSNNKILFNKKDRDLGSKNLKDYHIVFGEENSFLWTKSNADHFHLNDNEKLSVLTLTPKIPLDIGIFNKSIDLLTQELITEAIIQVKAKNLDVFGSTIGYHDYQKITDQGNNIIQQVKNNIPNITN